MIYLFWIFGYIIPYISLPFGVGASDGIFYYREFSRKNFDIIKTFSEKLLTNTCIRVTIYIVERA